MKNDALQKATKFKKDHQRKKRWYRIVTSLAAVVVFCTVYALILPAITMERGKCEIPEHTHTEECYTKILPGRELICTPESLGVHEHTDDCYDDEGELICGSADFVVHKHNELCYDEDGELVCQFPEILVHTHSNSCFEKPDKAEWKLFRHVHNDDCYSVTQGALICDADTEETEEESTETATDSDATEKKTVTHHHTDSCYEWEKELICEKATEKEEKTEKGELICAEEAIALHKHSKKCYDSLGNLKCEKLEVLEHVHTDECFRSMGDAADPDELTCGLEENENHTHSALCYGTWVLTCEKEEHTHTLACYSDPTVDVESPSNWEATLPDTMTGEWRIDVLRVAESQLGYMESTENYEVEEDGTTTRGYTRYGEWYGDPYGDWCAMFTSFCLHYADVPEEIFPQDADCANWISKLESMEDPEQESGMLYRPAEADNTEEAYIPAAGDLVFFDKDGEDGADHVGLVAELITGTDGTVSQIRTIEGNSENKVRHVTYEAKDPKILGYGVLPDQGFTCKKTGHIHKASCRDSHGELICDMDEHIHTEECKKILTELSYSGVDYTVSVVYGEEAGLPEGVILQAEEIPADSEEYEKYYNEAVAAVEAETEKAEAAEEAETIEETDKDREDSEEITDDAKAEEVLFARFFDIRFLYEGEEIEPEAPVTVTITYADPVETGEQVTCQAVHFGSEGTEVLEVETQSTEENNTSFTHTQNSFSVVGTVLTARNAADIGPNSLPVDYYVCIDGEWTCVGSTKTGWYAPEGAIGWADTDRDYITVEQAASILENYRFGSEADNPARIVAYQLKNEGAKIYSDTSTVERDGKKIIPLSRDSNHPGYNLYCLPANTKEIKGATSAENLDKAENGFYTINVYDSRGQSLKKDLVFTGGSFTYTIPVESAESSWIVSYGNGTTKIITENTIEIPNITSSVTISPSVSTSVDNSVTFKVMIDGEWQTVGTLPYYYRDNGSQRAYITSGMAAQFFGDFGYGATEEPGYRFGYSYNDIYSLFYANGSTKTNFCMDVSSNVINEAQVIQLWTSNNSDAQVFRIWDAGNGYSFITPINDSSYHVNVYGYTTGDPSSTQLKLSSATNENSQWKVDTGSDGRTTFWSAIAPEDQVIDLNNANMTNGGKLQVWHSTGGARYWYMVQQYRIHNDTASAQNADGTYNIGLTSESNGDIVCYYLPGETGYKLKDAKESDSHNEYSFWSVSVKDDTHSVYSDGDLSNMVQYKARGGEAAVTVKNANGILWSVAGAEAGNVTTTQADGYTTFVIKNITQPVEVVATKTNPTFTVQYYANIPRFATSGNTALKVIDTSGKVLPTNGGSMAKKDLYLEGTGKYTNQNKGNSTELYRVRTTTELTKMYTEQQFEYAKAPGLKNFNKLKDNQSYTLKEIWVLKAGKDQNSTNHSDWNIYTYRTDTAFTNEAGKAGSNTILIEDGAVIRLVSDSSTGDYYNNTTFYDYNISSGQNNDGRWRTGITGINSESNYGTSLNGQRTWRSGADILAFGNANCGTGMSGYLFAGSTLNKYSSKNSSYGGATFELAAGLNSDGTIRYNGYIVAPKLFNDGDATGKQTYSGSSLTFDRVGDTYVLSAATLKNSNGQSNTLSGLQYFFNPSPTSETTHTHIFTNNFWPMDKAAGRTDALWGKYGSPGSFQGFAENSTYSWSNLAANFPQSDDGQAHNWFFGMNFSLNFSLTKDYEGPLEYYFFGDDDMWVFLDQQLICDIGGVHSAIGEYVNLRDYLPVGSEGQHTLSFFYTERGASGSTCYMSFTLPSVSSTTTEQNTGGLQITKKLGDTGDKDFSNVEYEFSVTLKESKKGNALKQTFSYSKSDGTYGTVNSGGTIKLKRNETATIKGIPAGTYYEVEELTNEGYKTTVNNNVGYIVSGNIETGIEKPANFVNTPYFELPQTGGFGTKPYTIGGLLFMTAGISILLLYKIIKRRKEDAASF